MREINTTISLQEFKRLVYDLSESQHGSCMRYRLIGEMWYHNFVKVLRTDEQGLTMIDEVSERMIVVRSLSSVVQFELDRSFQSYRPNAQYDIISGREFILF